MDQKTIHTAFEASMQKVTSEHEEGDVLYAVVTEATDELERAQKDQHRLQDELDCSCEDMATAVREFLQLLGRARSSNCKKKEKPTRNELPTRGSALKLGKRGKEHAS